MNEKKTLFSAIQPSGTITLGNYIGAIKNWIDLQDKFDCIFALADLHTITVRQDPKAFRKNTIEAYALLLACGINIKDSIFFIQSHVPAHSQLSWVLSCYTQFGELSRMTQFKDKSQKHSDNITCGLFSYPVLMASDILLYQADVVPVGADQKQHLELTRNVAERFNSIYTPTFKIPEPYIHKNGAKIMSLQEPLKKMSKSDSNPNSYISILDKPDDIIKKFKRAITDSESSVRFGEGKDGINNLMTIYSCMTNKPFDEIENEFSGLGYGEFKLSVAQAVIDKLTPIQTKFTELLSNKDYLEKCYKESAEKATYIANKTLNKVMKKIGFIN